MRSFWTTADLLARGRSPRDIRRAVEQGKLSLVRRGVFAVPGTPEPLVRAARVGGVATSITAAAAAGLWTPPDPALDRLRAGVGRSERERLHVAFRRTTSRLHDPDDGGRPLRPGAAVVVHRTEPAEVDAGSASGIAPVLTVLEHVFRSVPPEQALAVLDSALHHRFVRTPVLAALADRLPRRLRGVVMAADGRADSGIETIASHLLRLAGPHVAVHPVLDGIGEVDLLVEGRLIFELDGTEFHDGADAFERDRHRDPVAASTRYRSIRFTWRMVLFEWSAVEAAVFAALS